MDFFKDLPRQLLRTNDIAQQLYKSQSKEGVENSADADLFYDLAVKSMTTQMAFLEQNRVNHLLLKNVFDSFQ